jgi:Family of unknown function (DUF6502)
MAVADTSSSQNHIKETAFTALQRIIDPLTDLMLDAGITVHELCGLARERAVRIAARRITKGNGRVSKSQVAIVTGLPRSEVARILNAEDDISKKRAGQHPAGKVLEAWYGNQRFLTKNGDPAVLPIFGRRRSFEYLVARYSGGIPVRAMLDQLTQIGAVEILAGQFVKAHSRLPIFTGLTTQAITSLGERTGDLLETLKRNLRSENKPFFEATAVVTDVESSAVPLIRRDLADQGVAFIEGANSMLARSRARPRSHDQKGVQRCRVGVTVFYFQDELSDDATLQCADTARRKNLHRKAYRARK